MSRRAPPLRRQTPGWDAAAERGSPLALGIVSWCFRRLGSGPMRLLLAPIAAYYCVFALSARRASQRYLERVHRARGSADVPRLRDTYRHFHNFAESILDRFLFWSGRYDEIEVKLHGREQVRRYFEGNGAFLVGAHLGSFDALRVIARDAGIPVNVIMFRANARRINQTLEALDPGSRVRVIELDPMSVRAAFEVRRCAGRGEVVAVLADRLPVGARGRVEFASFLGSRAAFPQGPFLVPMVLGLPLLLVLALKSGPRRYDIHLEVLSEGGAVAHEDREKVLRERIQTFACRLEHYCLDAPYQWFNFYDFWAGAEVEHP